MITVLTGENSFEITRTLERIEAEFAGAKEKIDGGELTIKQLPDLLMGATLFSDKRLVVIRGLADNKSVWGDLPEWLPRVSDDIHLVLIDNKPDKRTRTYKELQKYAKPQDHPLWTDRDIVKAEAWTNKEATLRNLSLDKKSIQALVARVGVDQWQLVHALEKLAVLDIVTPEVIEQVIEAQPSENVFDLFDAALKGRVDRVSHMIKTLELTDDPYMVFGLLAGQGFQLATLAVADKPTAEIAKDIAAHPFVLSKLSSQATRLGKSGARKVIAAFAECDDAMKTSSGEPWLLIERALIKIATI